MKRPNPLPTEKMTDSERLAEMCGLLALGLIRLRMQDKEGPSDATGESCLHSPPDQWPRATPTHRRNV